MISLVRLVKGGNRGSTALHAYKIRAYTEQERGVR